MSSSKSRYCLKIFISLFHHINSMFLKSCTNIQEKDLKDITDEIRKLKAIIVKHENRIRALEAIAKNDDEIDMAAGSASGNSAQSHSTTSKDKESENSTGGHTNLAPDEV